MVETEAQLNRIAGKLDEVRRRGLTTFGSGSHGFVLGPPASEGAVRAFEVEHGIALPDGYRAFITRVGYSGPGTYGGAGPYYGLFALEAWDDFYDWISHDTPSDWLARSSPLRPGPNALPEIDDDLPDDDWPGEELLAMYAGILTLGSRGCSFSMGLIITGEARGRVVYLDAEHSGPYVGRDADFLDWYERWLDELLDGFAGSWFGYGPAGGESELLELIASTRDEELRVEAINNLNKIPSLTDRTFSALTSLVTASSVEERAAVANTLRRAPPGFVAVLAPMLQDEAADLRLGASRALVEADPERWGDAVWAALMVEHDERVQVAMFHSVKAQGLVDPERAMAIVMRPEMGATRGLAAELVEWTVDHMEVLLSLIEAPQASVRRVAAGKLVGLELPETAAPSMARLEVEDDEHVRTILIHHMVRLNDHAVVPFLVRIAGHDHDFARLDAVKAMIKLGADAAEPFVLDMLAWNRCPSTPNRSHSLTFPQLLRPELEKSPSPKLRALGKVV